MAGWPNLFDAADMAETGRHDLDRIRVADCMHHGIISCDSAAPLTEVAATMCVHRVHAVVVSHDGHPGIVSDTDLIAAADRSQDLTALEIAATEWVAVSAERSLSDAARLMTEHAVTHLIVVDPRNGHPTGVISTTDLMSAIAAPAGVGSRA